MADINDVLSELRPHITPKPAQSQHPETGSAAVARRRLAHPGRDGVVAEDAPVPGPIKPERNGGVVVGDDPLSPLIRRLSTDRPELMEEIVAFIERRTAELNGGAAPRPTESVAPAALMRAASTPQDDDAGKTTIMLLFDAQVLARIDADAKRMGISRVAWLHVAADERLGRR